MFNFFIKNKKIILECFCVLDYVHDYTPVDYGTKFYPSWWKDTQPVINDGKSLTVKNCAGLIEFYKRSVVIPSWFEMDLKIYTKNDPEKRYYSYDASNQHTIDNESHHQNQFKKFALDNGHNLKITSPWGFRTKESINWSWTQPTWNMRDNLDNFVMLPAVVNYKYQHSTNINFFVITGNEEKRAHIAPNTPLVMLHPMTEKDVEIKTYLVDEKEYKRLMSIDNLFLRRDARENAKLYNNKKNFIEKMSCPINHDKF